MLQEMPRRSLEADLISCDSGATACEKGTQWETALALLLEMLGRVLKPGVQPDLMSYNSSMA